jgi:hypothetical protein
MTEQAVDPWLMTPEQATAALAEMASKHSPPPDANSPAGARAALAQKLDDPAFAVKFAGGSPGALAEFRKLFESGSTDRVDRIISQTAEVKEFEINVGGEVGTRNAMLFSADLLESGITPSQIKLLLNDEPLSREDYACVLGVEREKLNDPAFVKRWLAGGFEEGRLMRLVGLYKTIGYRD